MTFHNRRGLTKLRAYHMRVPPSSLQAGSPLRSGSHATRYESGQGKRDNHPDYPNLAFCGEKTALRCCSRKRAWNAPNVSNVKQNTIVFPKRVTTRPWSKNMPNGGLT